MGVLYLHHSLHPILREDISKSKGPQKSQKNQSYCSKCSKNPRDHKILDGDCFFFFFFPSVTLYPTINGTKTTKIDEVGITDHHMNIDAACSICFFFFSFFARSFCFCPLIFIFLSTKPF